MGMLFISFLWFRDEVLYGSIILTDLASTMVSYDRCLNVLDIAQEDSRPYDESLVNWPSHGKIEFDNYSLRYRPDTDLVLKDVSFTINPQEKIGVVGRTGAGKSTLCLALCRIVEAASGRILIDGFNIASVSLQNLRDQIAIIPQDPTLFEGSLRFNLDPEGVASNAELLEVLRLASLGGLVARSGQGLDQPVDDKGQNLSSGEKQLVCICRALVRKNKIVLMDEATANIDVKTEATIQQLMRDRFEAATVITVAHRLNTVVYSDRVLVLDKGRVAEFDTPEALLADKASIFYSFVIKLKKHKNGSR